MTLGREIAGLIRSIHYDLRKNRRLRLMLLGVAGTALALTAFVTMYSAAQPQTAPARNTAHEVDQVELDSAGLTEQDGSKPSRSATTRSPSPSASKTSESASPKPSKTEAEPRPTTPEPSTYDPTPEPTLSPTPEEPSTTFSDPPMPTGDDDLPATEDIYS